MKIARQLPGREENLPWRQHDVAAGALHLEHREHRRRADADAEAALVDDVELAREKREVVAPGVERFSVGREASAVATPTLQLQSQKGRFAD